MPILLKRESGLRAVRRLASGARTGNYAGPPTSSARLRHYAVLPPRSFPLFQMGSGFSLRYS